MSVQNIARFMEEVEKNAKLQARIKAAAEAGGCGAKENRNLFEKLVRPFAEEMGLVFTEEEYREFVKNRTSEQQLSCEDLDRVTGGVGSVSVQGTGGDVTILDQSQNVMYGLDTSFIKYLVDKFY